MNTYRILGAVLAVLLLAGCGGPSPAPSNSTDTPVNNETAGTTGIAGLPVPSALLRLASAQLSSQLTGSDYVAAWPHKWVLSSSEDALMYSPHWETDAPDNGTIAYAMYELATPGEAHFLDLQLSWTGDSPPAGTIWVGAADFSRDAWSWYQPAAELLLPTDIHVDAGALSIAVLLTADGDYELGSLGLAVTDHDHRGAWPMFGHDEQHTHRSPYVGPADPEVKWTFTAGDEINSSPVLAADGTIYFGSEDRRFYAFYPNGTLRWSFDTVLGVHASAAVAPDGAVYFGCFGYNLYALNRDGSERWRYPTGYHIFSSPLIGPDGSIYFGGFDLLLHAVNPDGTAKWLYPVAWAVDSSPAFALDGTIIVGSRNNRINAVNPDTGAEEWFFPTGGHVNSSPAIGADGTIYAGCGDGNLYALWPDGSLR